MKKKLLIAAAAAVVLAGGVFAVHAKHVRAHANGSSCDWVCPLSGRPICPKQCPKECGAKPAETVDSSKPQE